MLCLMIQFTAYSQQSIAERHAVETYFKNAECNELLLVKDSVISLCKLKYAAQTKYSDSLVWSFYSLKSDANNLELNAKKAIASEKKKAAIKNVVLEILIPVVIAESVFIWLH